MAQDLATLAIVVDASGAIRTVEQLNTSLDRNAKVAKQSEAAALATGRTWQSVATAGRVATRSTATLAQQQTVLGQATTISGRQMSVAAQRSLMLADALARGSASGATMSARLIGLGQTAGMVLGPAGIAVVAATGFAALIARVGDEAKAAREELEKFSRVTFANRDLDAAGRRFVRAREGDPESDTELGRASRGSMQAELDQILASRRREVGGGVTFDLTRAETLRVKALREVIALRVEEEKAAQALIDKLAPLKVGADALAEAEERRVKAARELARAAEEWAESLKRGAANAALIDRIMGWEGDIRNRNRGVARSVPGPSTGDPMAPIGLPNGRLQGRDLTPNVRLFNPDSEKEVSAFGGLVSRTISDAVADGATAGLRASGGAARVFGDVMSSAISGMLEDKLSSVLSKVASNPVFAIATVGLGLIFGRHRQRGTPVISAKDLQIAALNRQLTRAGMEAEAAATGNQIRTGVAAVLTESTAMKSIGIWEAQRRIQAETLAVSKAIFAAIMSLGGTATPAPAAGGGGSATLEVSSFDRSLGSRSSVLRAYAGSAVVTG